MGARRAHRVLAGTPWQSLRHRRSAAAATVRTNPEGTERLTQAEAVHEQVEHAAKNTCQGPWGMVGMRVITAVTTCIALLTRSTALSEATRQHTARV